jgi:hypothetical protein
MIGFFFKSTKAGRAAGADALGRARDGAKAGVDRSAAAIAEASHRMRARCEDDLAFFLAARRGAGAEFA